MSLNRSHSSPYFEARSLAVNGTLKVRWHDRLGVAPSAFPTDIDLADKVEGMLLGLAIGDSLGNTSESMNPIDRANAHGWISDYLPNRIALGRRVGLPSDDTQLAFWTVEQLTRDERLEPQLLGNAFCRHRIYGLGSAMREFLGQFKAGTPWNCSGSASAGNGALMRIAPVLLPYLRRSNYDLWADTLLAAHLTHNDELSNTSCVAMVHMLWQLIGMTEAPTRRWWIEQWLAVIDDLSLDGSGSVYTSRNGHPPNFKGSAAELIRRYVVPALDQNMGVVEAGSVWHSGAYLLETVPTVLFILSRFGGDPREAILQAVNHTRDNDTIAAIVGAAVGALHGASSLPRAWVDSLLGRTRGDDDHRVFELLAAAGDRFGYGVTQTTRERAALRASSADVRAELPRAMATPDLGQVIDLGQSGRWIKIVEFLQQNWAVILPTESGTGVRLWFFDDGFNVFDLIELADVATAQRSLSRNGFEPYTESKHGFVASPVPHEKSPRFSWRPRRIYSTGEFWITQ